MRDDTGKPDAMKRRIGARFLQARFFVGALLFHVAVFLIFATKIVVDAIQSGEHTFKPDTFVIGNPTPIAPDRPVGKTIKPGEFDASPRAAPGSTGPRPGELIIGVMTDAPKGTGLAIAPEGRSLRAIDGARTLDSSPKFGKLDRKQLNAIGQIRRTWFIGPERGYGKMAAEFTVHVGRPAEGGDSLAFVRFGEDNRQIIGGSVPNLAEMLNRFSKGRIRARVQGEVLRLDSREIFETKPPFIYLTGRSDFRLTEAEIMNIREYLLLGGCIWGDNALPGYRSKFDVAFRREMKRVIPDDDKPFEPLPASHPIYGNGGFRFNGTPAGLNFARLPVETIKIDGVEAIIYTANGYGAMWQVTFDDSLRQVDNAVMQRTEKEFWEYRKIFYRNLNEETLLQSYRLGYNIVLHLLLRYEAKIRGFPQT